MAQDHGKPGSPPADLNRRKLHLAEVQPRGWRRLFSNKYGPCFYSPSPGNRFSSAACKVLYFGDRTVTAFWETFWDDLGPLAEADRILSKKKLMDRDLVQVSAMRSLRVLDATNARALRAVSATPGTFGGDYAVCQVWAAALLNHPEKPEGIQYASARHRGGVCLALFDGPTGCADLHFTHQENAEQAPSIRALLTRENIGVL